MQPIVDPVLGRLEFDYTWRRAFVVRLFGKDVETILRVENDEIDDTDRAAFTGLERQLGQISSSVESAVENYCRLNIDRPESDAPVSAVMGDLVSLHHISILYSLPDARRVGFVFDADFDRELGIGVLVVNEAVAETGVQDIVL